jgi:hypothetical protein
LSWLYAPLTIGMKFLAIGTKPIFAKSLPNLRHELQVIREVMDGIEL